MSKSKNSLIGALLVVGLVGGVMVGAYVVTTPDAQRVRGEHRRPREGKKPVAAQAGQPSEPHTLRPRISGADVSFERHPTVVPEGVDPKVHVVNEYLKESEIADPSARLLGVDIRDGVAYLDFNRAFSETQGSASESILVKGILTVMGQFQDVNQVQFQIEGEPLETLGHLELGSPQDVIRNPAESVALTSER